MRFATILLLFLAAHAWAQAPLPPVSPVQGPKSKVQSPVKGATLLTAAAVVVVSPPASITVTSSLPVMFLVSPSVMGPFTSLGSAVTNRVRLNADQARQFLRGLLANFPVTNLPVRVQWVPSALAAKYRIYFGQASSNYNQVIELPSPATNYATLIWRAWPTNFCNMTALDSNNVESVMGKEVKYTPLFYLGANRN